LTDLATLHHTLRDLLHCFCEWKIRWKFDSKYYVMGVVDIMNYKFGNKLQF